jgi:O-acetyl-ADP-ribose deacetylase (regulator of RNase III)
MTVTFVKGNLLDSKDKYIAHQTNCVSVGAGGIAAAIFSKFPHSDIYSERKSGKKDVPGEIIISGDHENRLVINMMAQYYPGRSKFIDSKLDGIMAREKYFQECLDKILSIPGLESIAFPYRIGCGLAGGDWNRYLPMIEAFAEKLPAVKVSIWVME